MTNRYTTAAEELQRSVKFAELEQLAKGLDDYDSAAVRQAIVHSRQDLVLAVSHLSSLNRQVATIRRLAWILVALAVWALVR